MNNTQKLMESFIEALRIDKQRITDDLQYNSIEEWDSVAHMALIGEIEEQFNVMLDTDDIINMSTPMKAKEILEKYGLKF